MMRAGLLTEKILIQKPIVDQNAYGANTVEWQDYINTRAKVTYNSGTRANQNNEIVYTYEVIFTIRRYHDIEEFMRILWKNKLYRILNIDDRKQSITITAELIND